MLHFLILAYLPASYNVERCIEYWYGRMIILFWPVVLSEYSPFENMIHMWLKFVLNSLKQNKGLMERHLVVDVIGL